MQLFKTSSFLAQCERCGVRFDPVQGGVCPTCGRILCGTHMFGSWFRRMRAMVGGQPECAECRTGGPSARRAGNRPARPA